jgi:hypothetical protein
MGALEIVINSVPLKKWGSVIEMVVMEIALHLIELSIFVIVLLDWHGFRKIKNLSAKFYLYLLFFVLGISLGIYDFVKYH